MIQQTSYTAPELSFTFFLPSLQLINSCNIYGDATGVDPTTPQEKVVAASQTRLKEGNAEWQILCNPTRRLAWHLLGRPAATFALRQLPLSLFAGPHRLTRAQKLLHEAQVLEKSGQVRKARNTWEWVQREWRWISTSRRVQSLLEKQAALFAVPNPDELARSVLDSVTSELIPVLHLMGRIREVADETGGTGQSVHQEFLATWTGETATDRSGQMYRAYLNSLRNASQASIMTETQHTARLLENSKYLSDRTRSLLAETMAVLLNTWFRDWVAVERLVSEIEPKLEAIQRLFDSAPPSLTLMELISALLFLKAKMKLGEWQMITGAVDDLALSASYDPFNKGTRDQLAILGEEADKLQNQLAAMPPVQRANAAIVVKSLQERLDAAANFGSSLDGRSIFETRRKALSIELAYQLDLDPFATETKAILAQLQACLDEAGEGADNTEAYPGKVRQLAVARGEPLAALDWPKIEEAIAKLPLPSCEILALTLPRPAYFSAIPEDMQQIIDTVNSKQEPDEAIANRPKPWLLSGTWLFSSKDALWKLAAVAGLFLILHGSFLMAYKALNRTTVNKAYTAALAAVKDGNDSNLIHLAIAFLNKVPPQSEDPRVAQVAGLIQEATLREAVRLTQAGMEQQAVELLDDIAEINQQIDQYLIIKTADHRPGGAQ